ncbi:hypothetical protein [Spirosoma endophyticum]|uniref:hypothetical protein n=1 Tax=Spirosoma endophyticum TaxID=662367 RepID=UPI001160DB4E|nr:hypothetical protein [Spirosoma endophyticum]
MLPTSAVVTIPAVLDYELKAKLKSVSTRIAKGLFCTFSRFDDLKSLALVLGQDARLTDYPVRLFGYEIKVLYRFIWEQEKWRDIYWPPVSKNESRDAVWTFLAQLRVIQERVDVYASRPINGNG